MMQGPAKERLKIKASNAEWVSICGDNPTPGGYSFTCIITTRLRIKKTGIGTVIHLAKALSNKKIPSILLQYVGNNFKNQKLLP